VGVEAVIVDHKKTLPATHLPHKQRGGRTREGLAGSSRDGLPPKRLVKDISYSDDSIAKSQEGSSSHPLEKKRSLE